MKKRIYKIAICDDDKLLCSNLETKLNAIQNEFSVCFHVETFYDESKLENIIKDDQSFDLIFLDIELTKKLGSDIGKYIREIIQWEVEIIYISNNSQYALSLFETRPFDFLIKPLEYERLRKVIKKYLEIYKDRNDYFDYKSGTSMHRIKLTDIYYFESYNKTIKIHSLNQISTFYGKLSDTIKILPSYFFTIHQSFSVNYNQIIEINYDHVKMINGDILPISQSRRSEIRKKQMMKWVKKDD